MCRVASGEETAGAVANYECCRFRGSLVALERAPPARRSGRPTPSPKTRGRRRRTRAARRCGGRRARRSGRAPAIDPARNALYVTTGDNYSDPPTPTSDAFMAFDLASGKMLWSRQMTAADAWNGACRLRRTRPTAPIRTAPISISRSPPILVTLAERPARARGRTEIRRRPRASIPIKRAKCSGSVASGKGGINGGVQWGSAADQSNVYVALSDLGRIHGPEQPGDRARSESRRRPVRAPPRQRRAGLVHAAAAVRQPAALQSRAVGGGQRHSRCRVLGIG